MSWVNKETYENVTWPRYGSVYAWPLNYVLNYQKKHQAVKKLNALNWGGKSLQEVNIHILDFRITMKNRTVICRETQKIFSENVKIFFQTSKYFFYLVKKSAKYFFFAKKSSFFAYFGQ